MSYYPEISEALDIVADEAVVQNSEGEVAHLNILKEVPKRMNKVFLQEFDYIINDVFQAHDDNLYDLFYKSVKKSKNRIL